MDGPVPRMDKNLARFGAVGMRTFTITGTKLTTGLGGEGTGREACRTGG